MKRFPGSNSTATKDREAEIQQILAILHKWGIHTLGQLAALDKEELGARLGPEAVRMWERANGKSERLLKLVRPPESFDESFEFENEIETTEPLLFMLRRFLEQLTLRLSAIYLVAKELTLRITFTNPPRVRTQDGFVRRRNGFAAGISSSTNTASKFRSRPTTSIFCFGCCTRTWRILNRNTRLLLSRWTRSRSKPHRSNLDYLKRLCAIRINYQKHSRA